MKFLALVLPLLFVSLPVLAIPELMSYQGRILKGDGSPIQYNQVIFNFMVTDPSGQYVIWEELSKPVDMTNSNGTFDVVIGAGAQTYPDINLKGINQQYWTDFSLLDAFDNSKKFYCKNSTLPNCYQAVAGHIRRLRVQFWDGVAWRRISPDLEVRSTPFAGYAAQAEKLSGKTLNEFILKDQLPHCSDGSFLKWSSSAMAFLCEPVNITQSSSLPAQAGQAGKILSTDGTQAVWISSGSGGVSSVAAASTFGNPLSVSGTAAVSLDISKSSATTNGYLSSVDWDRFDKKQNNNAELSALGGIALTGFLQRTGIGSYATVGISTPLVVSGNNLGLSFSNSLKLNASNQLEVDFAATATAGKAVQANDPRLPSTACAADKKMRWDGSTWQCELASIFPQWKKVNANYTTSAGDLLLVDTSVSAISITLPASPSIGDTVSVVDMSGTLDVRGLSILRGGSRVMGLEEDMTVSTPYISFSLVYSDATYGWRVQW